MAVDTVSVGVVSGKFPESGKPTGKFSIPRSYNTTPYNHLLFTVISVDIVNQRQDITGNYQGICLKAALANTLASR